MWILQKSLGSNITGYLRFAEDNCEVILDETKATLFALESSALKAKSRLRSEDVECVHRFRVSGNRGTILTLPYITKKGMDNPAFGFGRDKDDYW